MSDSTPTQAAPRGRSVRLEPTPPGFWLVLLGAGVAALAPLFGFLIGGIVGSTGERLNPLFIALFLGILVGGLGVLAAILGGVRLWRHYNAKRLAEDDAAAVAARRARNS